MIFLVIFYSTSIASYFLYAHFHDRCDSASFYCYLFSGFSKPISVRISNMVSLLSLSSGFQLSDDDVDYADRVKNTLSYLDRVPVVRGAALETLYLALQKILTETSEEKEKALLEAVNSGCESLIKFLSDNPGAWSPLIFQWSLTKLAELCCTYNSKYRREEPKREGLERSIERFTTLPATGKLLEVVKRSMSSMMQLDPVQCVNFLLRTVQQYRSQFEWMLAYSGAMFSTTLMPALLRVGLVDFLSGKEQMGSASPVVDVLKHLIAKHRENIRRAAVGLFQDSLVEPQSPDKLFTVPYLLDLALSCPPLAEVMAEESLQILSPATLHILLEQSRGWDTASVSMVCVQVLSQLRGPSAFKVIRLLLNVASDIYMDSQAAAARPVTIVASSLVESLLSHLLINGHSASTLLLRALELHTKDLCELLSTCDNLKLLSFLKQLLRLIGLFQGVSASVSVLVNLLSLDPGAYVLTVFVQLHCEFEARHGVLSGAIFASLLPKLPLVSIPESQIQNILTNILSLINVEKSGEALHVRSSLIGALQSHIPVLANYLIGSLSVINATLQILRSIFTQNFSMSISTEAKLCHAGSECFLFLLDQIASKAPDLERWYNCLHQCKLLLAIVSRRSTGQALIVRLVVEAVLDSESKFMSVSSKVNGILSFTSLLSSNSRPTQLGLHRHVSKSFSAPSQTALHCRRSLIDPAQMSIKKETMFRVGQQVLDLLQACCADPARSPQSGHQVSVNGAHAVALVLLDVASVPGICIDGWPDEENLKVTLERDLQVKKRFDEHPFLWELLHLVSPVSSALSVCRPVLVSLFASQTAFWSQCRERRASAASRELDVTCRILNVIVKAGWLPSPITSVPQWIGYVSPSETHALLMACLKYFKEKKVEQGESGNCAAATTGLLDVLKIILQSNVDQLGNVYRRLFVQISL
ncbi:integrator complex subunit 5-like isoform X2 [Oscarella lobularis]|uniref:integrator complex subunit 5-like isoform X2 n=1 Tax=Oscarella lobularis TaxID=121494 RepID=UPI003313122B